MRQVLITGGRVIDPFSNFDMVCDLLIEGDTIRAIGPKVGSMIVVAGATVINASGLVVAPGFVDPHVHFREPGTEGETIHSGAHAAAAGGYTTVCVMPNTVPAIDNGERVAWQHEAGAAAQFARVRVIGALTAERAGKRPSDMLDMTRAGVAGVSDDGSGVQDAAVMFECMKRAGELGLTVSDHAEDSCLSGCGLIHEGEVSKRFNVPGKPSMSEWLMVQRDISLADTARCRLHIAHASAAETIEIIRQAKEAGGDVTVEVTPHHLALDDVDVVENVAGQPVLDPNKKMNPPLRSLHDRVALVKGVRDGTVDAIATDHAPHPQAKKDLGIEKAPNGVIGLETTFPVLNELLVHKEGIPLIRLLELLTCGPASCFNLHEAGRLSPGAKADIVILNIDKKHKIDPSGFKSKSRNTSFAGHEARGKVVKTIVGGVVVYDGVRDVE